MMKSMPCLLSAVLFTALATVTAGADSLLPGLLDGYVGFSTSDDCCPFNTRTLAPGTPLDILPEADYPYDATMNPEGTEVWIPGAAGDGVVVIDRLTNTITHRIGVGEYPTSVAFSDDGALALVSGRDCECVTVVDTRTYAVIDTLDLPTGYDGGNIALDPSSGLFYLVDWYDNTLFEIAADGSAILRQTDLGSSLWQLVVSPDGELIYVTDRSSDQVRVVDRDALVEVTTVTVGEDPWGIDITLDGTKLVVVCEDSHDAYIVETGGRSVTHVPLAPDADPRDVDILDDEGVAFICGGTVGSTDPVFLIDLAGDTLLTSFDPPGSNSNVIAVQPQMTSALAHVNEEAAATGGLQLTSHPNPSNPATTLLFDLPKEADVSLKLYDVTGRLVSVLTEGRCAGGLHSVGWDGRDLDGEHVPSGIYLARLIVDSSFVTAKIVLLR